MIKAEKIIKAIQDSDIQKIFDYPCVISVTDYGLLITYESDLPFPIVIQITRELLEECEIYDNEIVVNDIVGDVWTIRLFNETPHII